VKQKLLLEVTFSWSGTQMGNLGRSASLVRPGRCTVVLPKEHAGVKLPANYFASYQDYEKVAEGLPERDFDR
jgi:hypothetical protein